MRWKRIVFTGVVCLVGSACATGQPPPSGQVGDLRGRVAQVEKDQGMVAVTGDAEDRWFKVVPLTAVSGPDISTIDGLKPGQRVYVRFLRERGSDPPELLSITVIKYRRSPRGGGVASFGGGF